MLTFTRAYFDRKPVEVSLKDYKPAGAVLTVLPLTDLVKQQFVKKHRMCRTCLGLGFFAWADAPAGKCPTCGGKEGPSYADGEIRRIVFREIVTGWAGFKFEDDEEIPFTDDYRDAVADNTAFFFQVFNLASEAGVKTSQDEEGN